MARTRRVHHSQLDHVGVLRRIEHLGMSKGRRGSKHWLYVGTGLWTLRTIRRMADRREEILISETLQPGQRLIISNDRATIDGPAPKRKQPRTKRGRKKQAKADAKVAKVQAKADAKASQREANLEAKRAAKYAKKAKRVEPVESIPVD